MARAKRFVHNDNNLAFIYARYSSDAQRDCSIEQQIEEAKKYCKKKGYKVKKEFIYQKKKESYIKIIVSL